MSLIAPVLTLIGWTFVMWVWLYATRIPAVRAARLDLVAVSRTGAKLDLPPGVTRVADNYNHLHEQPTLFYAVAISLALLGGGDVWINLWLAWGYVGFRIVHSLIQATTNVVRWRFLAFLGGSFCLLGLTVHAAARVLHGL